MEKQTCASTQSVQDFRDRVAASLGAGGAVLFNLIDVLTVGPRPSAPVELALSELFAFEWSSLYQALRRAGEQLAPTISESDWLEELRRARLSWLQEHRPEQPRPELGPFKVRILDATNYDRPKTRTVEVGYVHGAAGMKIGHGLSLLQRAGRLGELDAPAGDRLAAALERTRQFRPRPSRNFCRAARLGVGADAGGRCAIHGRTISSAGAPTRRQRAGAGTEQSLFLSAAAALRRAGAAPRPRAEDQTQ